MRRSPGPSIRRPRRTPKAKSKVKDLEASPQKRGVCLQVKTVTPKKIAHLTSIASKGGKTMTDKKREHLRKALAARWAKARAKTGSDQS